MGEAAPPGSNSPAQELGTNTCEEKPKKNIRESSANFVSSEVESNFLLQFFF